LRAAEATYTCNASRQMSVQSTARHTAADVPFAKSRTEAGNVAVGVRMERGARMEKGGGAGAAGEVGAGRHTSGRPSAQTRTQGTSRK